MSVLGSEFSVTEHVAGCAVQTRTQLDELDARTVDTLVNQVVATLAELHRVDHVAIGLENFGRSTGYAARQLATWSRQWENVGLSELDPLARDVTGKLMTAVQEQVRTSVVHGDYRLDNTLVTTADNDTRLLAVVDWELSTIGDPVADVALMAAYRHPAFDLIVGGQCLDQPPTALRARSGHVPLSGGVSRHRAGEWF